METFEYSKPEQNFETTKAYFHSAEISSDGRKVGDAQFVYKNEPFPYYYLSFAYINKTDRGKGLGNKLVQEFNSFLDSHGKAGILLNSIEEPEVVDIYKKNGWEEVADHPDWFIYNPPKNMDKKRISVAIGMLILEGKSHLY